MSVNIKAMKELIADSTTREINSHYNMYAELRTLSSNDKIIFELLVQELAERGELV